MTPTLLLMKLSLQETIQPQLIGLIHSIKSKTKALVDHAGHSLLLVLLKPITLLLREIDKISLNNN